MADKLKAEGSAVKNTILIIGVVVLIFLIASAYLTPKEVPMINLDESIEMYIVADPIICRKK